MPFQKLSGRKKACPFYEVRRSEKEIVLDGALLELKKGDEPCNCRKLLFGFHIEHTSLSFVSKPSTSMPCVSYVMGCTDVQ